MVRRQKNIRSLSISGNTADKPQTQSQEPVVIYKQPKPVVFEVKPVNAAKEHQIICLTFTFCLGIACTLWGIVGAQPNPDPINIACAVIFSLGALVFGWLSAK